MYILTVCLASFCGKVEFWKSILATAAANLQKGKIAPKMLHKYFMTQ